MKEPQTEEISQYDDTVIGTAIKWSVVIFLILLVGGAVAYLFLRPEKKARVVKETALIAPVVSQRQALPLPTVKFTDVTKVAGITFVHNNGAYGDKLLPETMGS